MTTWRTAGISFTGEFTETRGVFLSGGLDPNVKNVMVSRCLWFPLASSVLSGGVIKKERESRPRGSHIMGHWLDILKAYSRMESKFEE